MMAEWKKICCAIDFSESSRRAMERAADLAKRLQGDLTLLHVCEVPAAPSAELAIPLPRLLEHAASEIERDMVAWRSQAEQVAGQAVRSKVLNGDAAEEIIRFANDGLYDLVVMGTHGRTGFKHLVLGSVAERVVRQAGCPVLVVRGTTTSPVAG